MTFDLVESYRPSEYDGHSAIVSWLQLLKNQHVQLSYNASPNECIQMSTRGKAKKMGMRTGWPDLEIYYKNTVIFFEFKLEKGELGPEQIKVHKELRNLGYPVHVVRYRTTNQAVEKVAEILRGYGMKEAKP